MNKSLPLLVFLGACLVACGSPSTTYGPQAAAAPTAIQINNIVPVNGGLTVYWTPSQNVFNYVVQVGSGPGAIAYAVSNTATSPLSITGLTNGTPTYVLIAAINNLGATYAAGAGTPGGTLNWNAKGIPGFSPGSATSASMAIDWNGNPYVAYQDSVTGNATVMTNQSGTWTLLGNASFTSNGANNLVTAVDPNGNPYIAFQDTSHNVNVMEYTNGAWTSLGTSGFATNGTGNLALAIDWDSNVYVAIQDASASNKLSVMEYTNGAWAFVGSEGLSSGAIDSVSLALDSYNNPYVAYTDASNSDKVTVLTYQATAWNPVGSSDFTATSASQLTLALDPFNTPYVAYMDASSGVTVMSYTSAWSTVGSADFSSGSVDNVSFAIDPFGTPYVAFADSAHASTVTVMSFNGTAWSPVVSTGVTAGEADATALAIDPTGIPMVAAADLSLNRTLEVYQATNTTPATALIWGNSYPSTSTALTANWTASSDASVSNQLLQAYSDEFCNTASGSAVNIGSPTSASQSLTGISGQHISYRIGSVYQGQQTSWSACSSLMGVTSLFDYVGNAINPFSEPGRNPAIAVAANGTVYVAFQDAITGQLDVMQYATGIWTSMGYNLSAGDANSIALATDPNTDAPYVAYMDGANGNKVTVQTYASGAWSTVGSAGFTSSAPVTSVNIAVNGSSVPYIAYVDTGTVQPTVMMFSGGWSQVSTISATSALEPPSFAIDSTGELYVAYIDGSTHAANVVESSGGSWSAVGSANFSPSAGAISLAIGTSNQLFVAITDNISSSEATVYQLTSGWTLLGSADFSTAASGSLQLMVGAGNIPFVSYLDASTGEADVYTYSYSSSTWGVLGDLGYGGAGVDSAAMALDTTGAPWIAYHEGDLSDLISVRQYHP